jgi:3-oxoacyl-[acyl-carrier protein] reductase
MNRKTVIITGASRGLGRAMALKFGREGWAVAVNYNTSKTFADEIVDEINKSGGEAFAVRADVRKYSEVEAMISETISRFGRIDALINNAGTGTGGLMLKLSEHTWDEVMDINLKGCFNTIKAVSRIMMKQRSGHIINISSILGVRGKTGQAAYSSSKAGLIGLTKAVAAELAPRGIQVNAVLPGYMLTDMGAAASEKYKENALKDNLLKRYSDPEEVAGFIYHIVGMKSASGQVFNLDSRII